MKTKIDEATLGFLAVFGVGVSVVLVSIAVPVAIVVTIIHFVHKLW